MWSLSLGSACYQCYVGCIRFSCCFLVRCTSRNTKVTVIELLVTYHVTFQGHFSFRSGRFLETGWTGRTVQNMLMNISIRRLWFCLSAWDVFASRVVFSCVARGIKRDSPRRTPKHRHFAHYSNIFFLSPRLMCSCYMSLLTRKNAVSCCSYYFLTVGLCWTQK